MSRCRTGPSIAVLVALALSLLAAACAGSSPRPEGATTERAAAEPIPVPDVGSAVELESTPPATSAPVATPPPEPTPAPTPTPEGLGRYLVARPGAGVAWQGERGADLVVPVYDEPNGAKRALLEVNAIDGVATPLPLFNWSTYGSPTVVRVVDGDPGDDWIKIQAPTRPHDTTVWVDANDWEWAETDLRIEINLSGPGELVVFDGDDQLLSAPIVQGRDGRETPEHVTYLEAGLLGDVWGRSPAYGDAVLMMASFSETLGMFGGGGSPQNFIHGTNQPGLMGQRVSSGEIRMTNDDLAALIELVHPGVPVLLFNGEDGRTRILNRATTPAATTGLVLNDPGSNATERRHPQLWLRCDEPTLVCLNPEPQAPTATSDSLYAIARAPDSEAQIPVFTIPWGSPRTLVDTNEIDGVDLLVPLYPRTVFGEPLVLRVLSTTYDEQWLRVQVPVRPNGASAWVRAEDFEVRTTTMRVEWRLDPTLEPPDRAIASTSTLADQDPIADDWLQVYDGDELVFETLVSSGRRSRPTPEGIGWISQILDGTDLSPAYGPVVFDVAMHSEALGSFGGGLQPRLAIHGIQDGGNEIGTRTSSGGAHTTYDTIERLAAIEGLLGAPVVIRRASRSAIPRPLTPTEFSVTTSTMPFEPDAEAPVPSFV